MGSKDESYTFDTSNLEEVVFEDIDHLFVHNGQFRCIAYRFMIVPPATVPMWVPVKRLCLPTAAVKTCANKALAKTASEVVATAKDFVASKLEAFFSERVH